MKVVVSKEMVLAYLRKLRDECILAGHTGCYRADRFGINWVKQGPAFYEVEVPDAPAPAADQEVVPHPHDVVYYGKTRAEELARERAGPEPPAAGESAVRELVGFVKHDGKEYSPESRFHRLLAAAEAELAGERRFTVGEFFSPREGSPEGLCFVQGEAGGYIADSLAEAMGLSKYSTYAIRRLADLPTWHVGRVRARVDPE